MSIVLGWIVFPVVLGLLALGCGLLVERLSGVRLPGALVLPVGLALVVVLAEFATQTDATAELAAPLVLIAALAGFVMARGLGGRTIDRWAGAAAIGVFAVFAAPTVLSGEATFAGYLKIEDTATWVAITDHVMTEGRSVDGLAPSSYEAILDTYLRDGYPAGSFLPLGVGRALVGQDLAWLVQPYMAVLAAMLALTLYALAARVVESRALRALVAFVAAQAALLFAYSLFGAIKELAAALLIALVAALAGTVMREDAPARGALPLAVASAAMIAALSAGAAVWLLPLLVPALVVGIVLRGERVADQAFFFCVAAGLLAVPSLVQTASFFSVAGDVLTTQSELGNLDGPLDVLQAFGIWPVGDFRAEPDPIGLTYLLIAVVAVAAVAGLAWAWRRRAYELLVYVGAVVIGALVVIGAGSPWTDAKALATASATLAFAGMLGAAAVIERGPRIVGMLAAVAIAGGVIWSNALAYREVDLAPRDRLAELQEIGERIEGEGPAMTTEYEFWGVRHFLRKADPESPALLHRRSIRGTTGQFQEGTVADVDEIDTRSLLQFRSLVLRRSPLASRPPSPYRLTWRGRYYELWQRAEGAGAGVDSHVPYQSERLPVAAPTCAQLLDIAGGGQAGGRLAVVERPPPTVLDATRSLHPEGWEGDGTTLYPDSSGTARFRVVVPAAGRFGFWLGGSFRGKLTLAVDGRSLHSARHELNYSSGQYVPMGEAGLTAGEHEVSLRYEGPDLHPGSSGDAIAAFGERPEVPFAIGPLVLSATTAAVRPKAVAPRRVRSVCGRTLDWVETLEP